VLIKTVPFLSIFFFVVHPSSKRIDKKNKTCEELKKTTGYGSVVSATDGKAQ